MNTAVIGIVFFMLPAAGEVFLARPGENVSIQLEAPGPVSVEPPDKSLSLNIIGQEPYRVVSFQAGRMGRYVLSAADKPFAEVHVRGIGLREVAWLLGGLMLFLYGMDKASYALRCWAGGTLRTVLSRASASRLAGVAIGMLLSAALQSSGAATVMLVGLASAGLIGLEQAVPVIMGAALGNTLTVQIIAFNLSDYSLFMVAVGALVALSSPYRQWAYGGRVLLGFGLIFLGMEFMKHGVAPLRCYPGLAGFLAEASEFPMLLLGVLIATAIAGVVQSSAAVVGLAISLAASGILDFADAMPLVLGATIGTTLTALASSLGARRPAVQTAVAHLLYKTLGVAMVLPLVRWLGGYESVFALGGGVERAIANFHTFVNLFWVFIGLPFSGLLARLTRLTVPDEHVRARDTFLDENLLGTPVAALEALGREAGRITRLVSKQMEATLPALLDYSGVELERLQNSDQEVDLSHRRAIEYARRLATAEMNEHSVQTMGTLVYVLRDLEALGDLISKDVVPLGYKRLNKDKALAMGDVAALRRLTDDAQRLMQAIAVALSQPLPGAPPSDPEARKGLEAASAVVSRCDAAFQVAQAEHFNKIMEGVKEAVESDAVFVDFLAVLRHVYYVAGDIVAVLLEPPASAGFPHPREVR